MSSFVLSKKDKLFIPIIAGLSLIVALLVATLFYMPEKGSLDVKLLPHVNAVLNTLTSFALLLGFYFVRRRQVKMHRMAMLTAFAMCTVFLISYVFYHGNAESTVFPKDEPIRYVYYFVLLTHILLSAIVVPLVLVSIYYALSEQIARHKKIVKFTFPIWLYVSVSGVVVYLMISPYYK